MLNNRMPSPQTLERALTVILDVSENWSDDFIGRPLRPIYDDYQEKLTAYFRTLNWRDPEDADLMAFAVAQVLDEGGHQLGDDERLQRALEAYAADTVQPGSPEVHTLAEVCAEWGGPATAVILCSVRQCRLARIDRRRRPSRH